MTDPFGDGIKRYIMMLFLILCSIPWIVWEKIKQLWSK